MAVCPGRKPSIRDRRRVGDRDSKDLDAQTHKEIQIATQDKPLRIRLKDRRSCLALGNTVRVYIHSRTPIYEQEGKLLLLEYLTLCTLANEEVVDAAKSA